MSIDASLTSHRKGFSPECWSEWTFRDMLRLNDFPHVSQVKGMSFVWAGFGGRDGRKREQNDTEITASLITWYTASRKIPMYEYIDLISSKTIWLETFKEKVGIQLQNTKGPVVCRHPKYEIWQWCSTIGTLKKTFTYQPCACAREPSCRTSSHRFHTRTSSLHSREQSWCARAATTAS